MVLFFGLITKEVVEATAAGGVLHPWRRAAAPAVASLGLVADRRWRCSPRSSPGSTSHGCSRDGRRLCDRRRVRLFRDPRHLWRASGGCRSSSCWRSLRTHSESSRCAVLGSISRGQSRPRARVHDCCPGCGGSAENGEGQHAHRLMSSVRARFRGVRSISEASGPRSRSSRFCLSCRMPRRDRGFFADDTVRRPRSAEPVRALGAPSDAGGTAAVRDRRRPVCRCVCWTGAPSGCRWRRCSASQSAWLVGAVSRERAGCPLPARIGWRELVVRRAGGSLRLHGGAVLRAAAVGPGPTLSALKMGALISAGAGLAAAAAAVLLRVGRFSDGLASHTS